MGNNIFYLKLFSLYEVNENYNITMPSLFASGAYSDFKLDADSWLFYIYGQYGLFSFILIILFIYHLINYIKKQFSLKQFTYSEYFASILLINIFVFYNMYVFSDFLNLFSVLVINFLFYIVNINKSRNSNSNLSHC